MLLQGASAAAISATTRADGQSAQQKPNVLLLCIDDLRPQLGCYGDKFMVTPHVDRLAGQGRLFNRHYVQSAVCGPSRCSLLTGKPYSTWDCWDQLRAKGSEPEYPASFAHLLRRNGYRTVCIGKVSHQPGGTMDNDQKVHQVPYSWDVAYAPVGAWRTPWRAFFGFAGGEAYNTQSLKKEERDAPRLPYEAADVDDEGYPDGLNAREAVRQLGELSRTKEPFLLAVGFYKPHLPFNAPKKYHDLYKEDLPAPKNPWPSRNTDPAISGHKSSELTGNHHWPSGRGVVTDEDARALRKAYAACVSYVDAQVGKVLDELKRLELDRNTVVILWSDHGWHLGEHGVFGKHTNYEVATRSPLIVRTPGMRYPGQRANGLTSTVDLYPTIAELCGVKAPADLSGRSLVAALRNPAAPGTQFAFSYHPRGPLMGRTVRTNEHRLVQWTNPEGATVQVELYDHGRDPEENDNVAGERPDVVKALLRLMPPRETILTSAP